MLRELPEYALPQGLYWVSNEWPETAIADWLDTRPDVTWVAMGDFDELMPLMRDEFNLPHLKIEPIQEVFDGCRRTFTDLSEKVLGLSSDEPGRDASREAAERAVEEMDDWWAFEIRAREFKETDPDRADQLYRERLRAFPESMELLGNYAFFLTRVRDDQDGAEITV